MSNKTYSKQDCISALQKAYEVLGESPTSIQYRELNIYPTYSVFCDKFGSWNKAKEAAGLDTYSKGRGFSSKPAILNVSTEKWKSLTPGKRNTLQKRCRIDRIKLNSGCQMCGFSENPAALDFHHINPDNKEFTIGRYIQGIKSWNQTKSEIHKCEVLCSNCHRMEESSWPNVE